MFRRKVKSLDEVVVQLLRQGGLETPLQQRRLVALWDEVAGPLVARYTEEKYIKNQTLCVKISNPALRANLSMRRRQLADELNKRVGSFLISDIRFY